MPLGITGLETEPYSYHNNVYYEGIGGEGEMSWFSFIAIIAVVIAVLGGGVYAYISYTKVNSALGFAGNLAQMFKKK